MEATQNYENSTQSLWTSLKGSEKREKSKSEKKDWKDRRQRKHSDTSDTSNSSSSIVESLVTESSESDLGPSSKKRSSRNRKGKETQKVKLEDDNQKQVMKNIQETLEAIKVNLTDNQKPRQIVPTSRANIWCSRCGDNGYYASECYKRPQKQVHFVDPETGVYYTISDGKEELELNPVYRVQPVYRRDKGVTPLVRTDPRQRPGQIGSSHVMILQARYPVGVCWTCGDPNHYSTFCHISLRQGAPLILPCQKCGEYGHNLSCCPKPQQVRPVYKQVEVPPRDQTGLNYDNTTGVENPRK